jgi:uncharacterized protein
MPLCLQGGSGRSDRPEMSGIVDFHAHAFPDELAERAINALEQQGGIKAFHSGTVSSLLRSMDSNGIETSVVCTIATKPGQFDPIFAWCRKIRSERIIPFPSIHPDDAQHRERISRVKGEGFKGIKFHPYYQEFSLDEERLFPIYERACEENLIVVAHTGFDIGFPRERIADPARILKVLARFPQLKLVTTHLGAWELWDEVEEQLTGREIYMEISCSFESLSGDAVRRLIVGHPGRYILFGTDSPWTDQGESVSLLKGLLFGAELEDRILRRNATELLASV